jgi:hypothetical protein
MGAVSEMVDAFVEQKAQQKEGAKKEGKNGKKRNQRIVVGGAKSKWSGRVCGAEGASEGGRQQGGQEWQEAQPAYCGWWCQV